VSLHQEVTHVPLLLRLPGVTQPGQVVDAPVEIRALYATLLDYLGLGGGDDSLLPLFDASERDPRTIFSDVWLPDAPEDSGKRVRRSMVRRGSWKLIRDHDRGLDALYDLARDPGETRNVAAESPDTHERLSAALDAWNARMLEAEGTTPVQALTDEERKRLEALGYL
jgi:arylsulfatase A-like enzyme